MRIAFIAMLTYPFLLIKAFVANRAKAGFLAPNDHQFLDPFSGLAPLNDHFIHAVIEFKGLGFVVMTLRRLASDITSTITNHQLATLTRITPKSPADGRGMLTNSFADSLLNPSRLEQGLNLIHQFKPILDVVFFCNAKDCVPHSNAV